MSGGAMWRKGSKVTKADADDVRAPVTDGPGRYVGKRITESESGAAEAIVWEHERQMVVMLLVNHHNIGQLTLSGDSDEREALIANISDILSTLI